MKYLLLTSMYFIIGLNTFGQSIYQTSYGDNDIDIGNSVIETTSNGYTVVGTNQQSTAGTADIILYNLDSDGSLLWSSKIGSDKNDLPVDVIQTSDGGYAITGTTFGGLIDSTTSDIFLLKTDDQGFPTLFQTFGGPSNDEGSKILNSPDGGFYIFGSTTSFGNALKSAVVIRTDINGNQIWTSVNSSVQLNSYSTGCFNLNGQLLAAGSCYDNVANNFDNYISLIDTNGNLLWSKRSGSSGDENISQIVLTSDGGIISAGTSTNSTAGGSDINICKFDSAGNVVWTKNYGTTENEIAKSIFVCSNGDYIVCGNVDIQIGSGTAFQAFILRIDSNGNLIWSNTYGDPSGNSDGEKIISENNNTIAMTGYIKTLSDPFGETYFVKTNANGNSGCYQLPLTLSVNSNSFTDSSGADSQNPFFTDFTLNANWQFFSNQFSLYCFNNGIQNISSTSDIHVFPNPTSGKFQIENVDGMTHHLDIYDALGQKVMQKDFGEDFVNVDMTMFSRGVYHLKIDKIHQGKIVLTDN